MSDKVDKEKLDTLYDYGQRLMDSIKDDYIKDMTDKAVVESRLNQQRNLMSEIRNKLFSLKEEQSNES